MCIRDSSGVVHYRERSNRCIGIPYRWEFSYADIDFVAQMDGGFDVNNTLTIEQKERLLEETIRLLNFETTIVVANIITVDLQGYIDLQLALDLETRLSITHQTKFDQDYDLRGRYETHLRCTSDGCEDRGGTDWGLDFLPVDRPGTFTQTTLDIVLRPSAELQVGVNVDVGVLGKFETSVFQGKVALGVDLPVRVYWTRGNACSDADGDGLNEDVSGSLIDATVRVYAYVEARLLGSESRRYIDLNVPNGWARKVINGVLDRDDRVVGLEKHVLLKVLSEGENSPLEPTINRAGLFQIGSRNFEGVEIGPVRSCYPFDDIATILIDFGDGGQMLHQSIGRAFPIPHDWIDDGANRTVRARVEFDSLGRNIKGPWVTVNIDENSNQPVDLTAPTIRLGTGVTGPELQWTDNGAASGFNIYRDGQYIDTVRDASSWSLAGEDGAEHRYSVTAFDDENAFTSNSNEIVYGGSATVVGDNGKPRAVVAMGDSFISGEAGRWIGNALSASKAGTDRGRNSYLDGTDSNNCHRSDVAEVQSAAIPGLVPINLACSNAFARHVRDTAFRGERPQVDQLATQAATHDIEMIVLSIGGNDLGFGPLLAGCIQVFLTGDSPCRNNGIYGKVTRDVIPEVRSTIEAIQETMRQAGDTDYRLVLQSYVSPVPRSSEVRYSSHSERVEGGCGFFDEDLDWARDTIVPILDDSYAALASDMGIEFLSLRDAMQGKEVCADNVVRATTSTPATAAGQDARLEWIRFGNPVLGITQGEFTELLHPNALGQQALGRCLAETWKRAGSTVHTCVRTGNTPTDMSVR